MTSESRRRGILAATLCALAVSPAGAAVALIDGEGAPAAGGRDQVVVTLLGNAGVRVAGASGSVLIDALFRAGIDGYGVVPEPHRERLETAGGEFADVVLVLATHVHRDHFDADAVARHLAANRRALFASTAEAVGRVAAAPGGGALADRLRTLAPRGGSTESFVHRGVRVTAYALHHGLGLARPVENLGLRVELEGHQVVHLGDAEASPAEIAAAGLAPLEDGLALVPFWRLLARSDREALAAALGASRLAALHVPTAAAPADWFGPDGGAAAIRSRLAAEGGPALELLEAPGTTLEVPRRAGAGRRS